MDDEWVTSITQSEVVTSAAYLLIYQRVHPIDPHDIISFYVARTERKKKKAKRNLSILEVINRY